MSDKCTYCGEEYSHDKNQRFHENVCSDSLSIQLGHMDEIQYITSNPYPITIGQYIEENTIMLNLDKEDVKLQIEFKPEGIWVNNIQKDVDNEWPEIYTAFKQFVRGSTT